MQGRPTSARSVSMPIHRLIDSMNQAPSRPFQKLLARLDLQTESEWVHVGGSGVGGVTADNRLYGGLVLAQAGMAAMRTVPELHMHSLHAHFLHPGRPDADIRYVVEPVKTGRNFHVRNVRAEQSGSTIFQLTASFSHRTEEVSHQAEMPDAPEPLSLPNRDQLRGRRNWAEQPIDVRLCDPTIEDRALPPHKRVWIKPQASLGDDERLHTAVLLYASDRAFLSTAWRPHAGTGSQAGASLDHAVWLHAPVNFNDWLLYQMESPVARFQRGLVQGAIYDAAGQRIASVAQEGLLKRQNRA